MNIKFHVEEACLSSKSTVIAVLDEFLIHTGSGRAGFPYYFHTVRVLIILDGKALIFNTVDEVEVLSLWY